MISMLRKGSFIFVLSLLFIAVLCLGLIVDGDVKTAQAWALIAVNGDLPTGATYNYDNETNTLTLDGANLSIAQEELGITAVIQFINAGDKTIELKGENTLTLNGTDSDSAGIYSNDKIKFVGDGSLSIVINNADNGESCKLYGIRAAGVEFACGEVSVSVINADNDDEVYGVYADGDGFLLSECDVTVSLPSNSYPFYNDVTGFNIDLEEGKVFSSFDAGQSAATARQITTSDLVNSSGEVQDDYFVNYAYIDFSVRTKYTLKHYVMNTSGEYPSTFTTETKCAKAGSQVTLSADKDTSKEVENGIVYASAKVEAAEATTLTVAADGTSTASLYYARSKHAVTRVVGAGTGFDLSCGDDAYYGETVTLDSQFVDTDRYENLQVRVSYLNNQNAGNFNGTAFTMPAAAVKVTSTATPKTFTVTLNTNGGVVGTAVEEYVYGTAVSLPTSDGITKTNGLFGGWYSNLELTGNPVTAISAVDYGNKTYYAKWTARRLTESSTAAKKSSLLVADGFDESLSFSMTTFTPDGYDYTIEKDFKSKLTSTEAVACVYRPELYLGTVKQDAGNNEYTLQIAVDTQNSFVKLLVVQNDEIIVKNANVTDGYAIFTVQGLNDFALIGAKAPVEIAPIAPATPDEKDSLLWLYILLPCLVVVGGAVAFFIIRKKKAVKA